MEESTIELGTLILERHRSTYQVRLEGMRPHEIESAAAILRFVASIERRWMLAATETVSIPLLMQINGSLAARQSRVIVTGKPLEKAQQGGAPGDIPIEQSVTSVSSSDHDHIAARHGTGTAATEAPAHDGESKNATPVPAVSETVQAASSSSASSPSPMTDRTQYPTATPASTVPPASEAAAPPGTVAEASGGQAQHAGQATDGGSAAGMPRAQATEVKPQTPEIDPDTVLSGAALLWTSTPSAKDADAAQRAAVKAVEASSPHPHSTPAGVPSKQPPAHVVTGAEAPATHPPSMEHPGQGTTPATAAQAPTASATPPTGTGPTTAQPGAGHPEQGGTPQKSAAAEDPIKEEAKKAAEKAAEEYAKSTVKGESLFYSPPPEPVLLAPTSVAQAPPHASGLPQPSQGVPSYAQEAGALHEAASQGTSTYRTTAAAPSGSNEVDLDALRAQFLRVFARDMALEAERRGVDTWDR